MALDFHCMSVLQSNCPGHWSSFMTLGEAAAWRQLGIHRACVLSRGTAVQPSLMGPGCFTQQKAARLTTWLKSETHNVFVLCQKCAVSILGLSICCAICPPLLKPLKHLFPFPSKRVRAGSKTQQRELDTAKPRTFLGQRKGPDGKRPSEGKPVAPFGQAPIRLFLLIGPEEKATHHVLPTPNESRSRLAFHLAAVTWGFEAGVEKTAGKRGGVRDGDRRPFDRDGDGWLETSEMWGVTENPCCEPETGRFQVWG